MADSDAFKAMRAWLNDPERIAAAKERAREEQEAMAAAKAARVYPQHYAAPALGKVLRVHADGGVELGDWRDGAFIPTPGRPPVVVRLEETSYACPEQYDAYIGDQEVGYLRLRHGTFYAEYPECGGREVYAATAGGDYAGGRFDPDKRDEQLDHARARLYAAWLDEWGNATPEALAAEVARQKAARARRNAEQEAAFQRFMAKRKEDEP
jgi:hypothetical protein